MLGQPISQLDRQSIELIYEECLLKQRFDLSMPFYIEDSSLCFYTARGQQVVPFSDPNQEAKFREVIQQAQQAAGLPSAPY